MNEKELAEKLGKESFNLAFGLACESAAVGGNKHCTEQLALAAYVIDSQVNMSVLLRCLEEADKDPEIASKKDDIIRGFLVAALCRITEKAKEMLGTKQVFTSSGLN